MHTVVGQIDFSNESLELRLSLLTRENLRRHRDTTLKTRFLSFADAALGLGYWWFRTFEYQCHNSDGTLWTRNEVRRTLAGYTIAWGWYTEYYDEGTKACEGIVMASSFWSMTKLRKHKYWLPDGTKVSQHEWMRYVFGPQIDGCHDPEWEK